MAPTRTQAVKKVEDILPAWRGTPVEELLGCQNLGWPLRAHARPQMTIVTCVDHRIALRLPEKFAYKLRVPGARPQMLEFSIAFTLGVGGVKALALIAHDDCLMVGLGARRQAFRNGMAEQAGWAPDQAERFFDQYSGQWAQEDPAAFVQQEAVRLRAVFPRLLIAPLLYRHADDTLAQLG